RQWTWQWKRACGPSPRSFARPGRSCTRRYSGRADSGCRGGEYHAPARPFAAETGQSLPRSARICEFKSTTIGYVFFRGDYLTDFNQQDVEILRREPGFRGFYRLDVLTLRHRLFAG